MSSSKDYLKMIPSPYEDNLLMDPREKIYSQAPIGRPCISQPPHKCLYQSYHHTRMYMNDFPKDSGVECNLVYSLRYGTYEFEVLALPFYTALQFYATTYEKHLLLFS